MWDVWTMRGCVTPTVREWWHLASMLALLAWLIFFMVLVSGIIFGKYAGIAGMIDILHGLGLRFVLNTWYFNNTLLSGIWYRKRILDLMLVNSWKGINIILFNLNDFVNFWRKSKWHDCLSLPIILADKAIWKYSFSLK